MRYIVIPALALVLLGTYLPHAFSDYSTYQLGSSTAITTSQGLVIHLLNMTDSRCPSGVACIWAGQVNATLVVQSQVSKRIVSLVSSPGKSSTVSFDNYVIQIADVQPYPRSGHTILLEDYIVTLKVESSSASDKIRLVTDSKACLAGVDTCVMAKKLYLAPLKQIRVGIGALDVACKNGYGLVLKTTNNMPSCVKSSTADILVQRGWAIAPNEITKLKMTYESSSR
jgi:hypothetical protein